MSLSFLVPEFLVSWQHKIHESFEKLCMKNNNKSKIWHNCRVTVRVHSCMLALQRQQPILHSPTRNKLCLTETGEYHIQQKWTYLISELSTLEQWHADHKAIGQHSRHIILQRINKQNELSTHVTKWSMLYTVL